MNGLRPIPSLAGYLACEEGHVYSTRTVHRDKTPRRLTETPTHDGYLRVRVVRVYAEPVVHQAVAPVVAEAFLGTRPEGMQVRHLNGDRTDNRPSNLAYGTAQDNAVDRDGHGTTARGIRVASARHTREQVRDAVRRNLAGESQHLIAAELGVSQATVSRWVSGQSRTIDTVELVHPVATWLAVA